MSKQTFLRNPPRGIHVEQRLALEALGYAIDVLQANYDRMQHQSLSFTPWDGNQIARSERVALFSNIWSMIDQAHVIRSLLEILEDRVEDNITRDFRKKFEAATILRNKMDHLHNNIENISRSEQRQPPVYGALSFVRLFGSNKNINITEPAQVVGAYLVTLGAGSLAKDKHRINPENPAGKELEFPLGFFNFNGFDQTINLSALHKSSIELEKFFNSIVKVAAEAQLNNLAVSQGTSAEELLAPSAEGLTVVLEIAFPPSQDGSSAT